jgi:hypothetical protein
MSKLPWARLVAEFGVIVVGVLVALLAESAWQERGERAEEREVLERIEAELVLDSAIIQDDVDWFGQLVPILEEARAVLRGESDLAPAPALAVVFTAGLRRTDVRDPRTFDDLLASGRLSLIEDPGIRQALMSFYGDFDNALANREALPSEVRRRVTATVPLAWARHIVDTCIRMGAESFRKDLEESLPSCAPAPDRESQAILDELVAVPGLTHEMGVLAYESINVHEDMVRAKRSLSELRDTLASVR